MKRVTLTLLVLIALLPASGDCANAATVNPRRSATTADELELVGTVTRIFPVARSRSRRNWAIVMRVERVVKGSFSGSMFTFTIHSPARAGLKVRGVYTIKATPTDSGYVVEETGIAAS